MIKVKFILLLLFFFIQTLEIDLEADGRFKKFIKTFLHEYTSRTSACIAYFRKCTSKIFPSFFFIHRFRCHSMYRIQPYMVPAVFSLVNDFFFFISLDSWQIFPGERESPGNHGHCDDYHEDDGNESSFISISGIVGQVLARKADTAAACRLRASHEGESYFHAFSMTVSVVNAMSEYTFDIATSKSSVEYDFTRGIIIPSVI